MGLTSFCYPRGIVLALAATLARARPPLYLVFRQALHGEWVWPAIRRHCGLGTFTVVPTRVFNLPWNDRAQVFWGRKKKTFVN